MVASTVFRLILLNVTPCIYFGRQVVPTMHSAHLMDSSDPEGGGISFLSIIPLGVTSQNAVLV
jgi:hypothetical protein